MSDPTDVPPECTDDHDHGPSPRVLEVLAAITKTIGRDPLSHRDQMSVAQMLLVNGTLGVRTIVRDDVPRARSIVTQVVEAALASAGGDVRVKVVDPGPTPKG